MIRLACPKCKERLVLDDETRGQIGQCPECNTRFRIPAARQPAQQKTVQLIRDEAEGASESTAVRKKKKPPKRRRPKESGISFEFTSERIIGCVMLVVGLFAAAASVAAARGAGAYAAGGAAGGGFASLILILGGIIKLIRG
jgi:uncharacterized Zn finger protein (UPF0148 family)